MVDSAIPYAVPRFRKSQRCISGAGGRAGGRRAGRWWVGNKLMSHISYPHDCIPSQSSTEDERFKVQNSCFQPGLTLGSARTTRVEREGSNMLILHSCMHHRQNWENFYWVSVSPNLSPLMSSVVLLPRWGEGEKKILCWGC